MSLNKQYDAFYQSDLEKESLSQIVLNKWPRNRVESIIYTMGESIPDGKKVLDIGCGNGHLLFQLKAKFEKLIGLEFSEHRLAQAEINLADLAFIPVCGSAENMSSIESDSVNCIVSADTIEHIPDVYKATEEMLRVLKPGGSLIINTPNIASIKKRLLLLFGRFPSTSQSNEGLGSDILFDGGHLHYFTFRSLTLLLQRAGFQVEDAIGYGRLGRIHDFHAPLLSGGVQLLAKKPVK